MSISLKKAPLVNQDLAIDLRVRLGDWFRVIQLAHGANEALMGWVTGDVRQPDDKMGIQQGLLI